jgi:MerR family transcriptional regulator, mercuric resistance operon regulatory protein
MKPITNLRELSIGQLSRVTQVPIETIRYWERLGLAPLPPRSRQGHRLYNDGHARQLVFIRRARRLGFGLRDLRSLLTFAAKGNASCSDVRPLAERHLERIRAELADLMVIEDLLARSVSRCSENSIGTCPVLDLINGVACEAQRIDGPVDHSIKALR